MARIISFFTKIDPQSQYTVEEELRKLGLLDLSKFLNVVSVDERFNFALPLPQQVTDVLNRVVGKFHEDDFIILPGHPIYSSLVLQKYFQDVGRFPRLIRKDKSRGIHRLVSVINLETWDEIFFRRFVKLPKPEVEEDYA